MSGTAGEQVGAVVDATVQEQKAQADDAIARAKADADAAAAEARRIADAAMSSELGGRIAATQQEFSTWRTATDQRLTEISEANKLSEARLQETTELLGSIRALLMPAVQPKSPTSAAAPDTAPMVENSGKTAPSEQPKVKAEEQPAPPPKRRHFL